MRRVLLVLAAILLTYAVPAVAQSPVTATPTSISILVLPPTGDPLTIGPIAVRDTAFSAALCSVTPSTLTPPTPLVNPTMVELDDPFNAGRKCRVPLPVGIPDGVGYRAVAVFVAPTCSPLGQPVTPCPSPRSVAGLPPFSIVPVILPPAAPTGLKVFP